MGISDPPPKPQATAAPQMSKNAREFATLSQGVDDRGFAFIESMVSRESDNKHIVRLTLNFLNGMVEIFETESEDYMYARKDVMRKANAIAQIIPRPPPLPIAPDAHFRQPLPTPPHFLHTNFPLPRPPPLPPSYNALKNDVPPPLSQNCVPLMGLPLPSHNGLRSIPSPQPLSHLPPPTHQRPVSKSFPSPNPLHNTHLFKGTFDQPASRVKSHVVKLRSAPAPTQSDTQHKQSGSVRGRPRAHTHGNYRHINNIPSHSHIRTSRRIGSSGSSQSLSPGSVSSPESLDLEPPSSTDPLASVPGRTTESHPLSDPNNKHPSLPLPRPRVGFELHTNRLVPSHGQFQHSDHRLPKLPSSSPSNRVPPQDKSIPENTSFSLNSRFPVHRRSPSQNHSPPDHQHLILPDPATGLNSERLGFRRSLSYNPNDKKRRKTNSLSEKTRVGNSTEPLTKYISTDKQVLPVHSNPRDEISKIDLDILETNEIKNANLPENEKTSEEVVKGDSVLEDDGANYVSMLNVIFTRHRNTFSFLDIAQEQVVGSSDWKITLSILKKTNNNKLDSIQEHATHINKKVAKQIAARKLLQRINQMHPDLKMASAAAVSPQGSKYSGDTASVTGVSILFNLFQKGVLQAKPNFTVQQVDGDEGFLWRVTCVAQPVGFDDVSCSAVEKKKVLAKHAAAKQVISELQKKKVPMLDEVLEVKPKTFIKHHPLNEGDVVLPENTEEMVRHSDDEDVTEFNTATDTYDDRLMLPSDYRFVVPDSEKEVDVWLGENVRPTTDVGVYLDSRFMRDELKIVAAKEKFDIPASRGREDIRVICLATESSAILLCGSRLEKRSKEKCWIPKSVVRVLTTRAAIKHGFLADEAALTLGVKYGIEIASINNIQVNAFSLSGEAGADKNVLMPIQRLVSRWLNKRFQPFSSAAIGSVPGLKELMDSTSEFVCPAALIAYACVRIGLKLKNEGAAKRFDAQITMPGFEDLAQRLIPLIITEPEVM